MKAAKRTIAIMTTSNKKRSQGKEFEFEKARSPTKRLKGFLPSKQKSTKSNKKVRQSVTWSTTVPENKVAERTIPRKGTPPRPARPSSANAGCTGPSSNSSTGRANNASIPSCITIINSEIPYGTGTPLGGGQDHVDVAECRAAAIKSSQLAVRMARSRALEAEASLELSRRRERQAMKALLDASNERIKAEKDDEAAKNDMKGAGEYLTELLKRSNIASGHTCTAKNVDVSGYETYGIAAESTTTEFQRNYSIDVEDKDDGASRSDDIKAAKDASLKGIPATIIVHVSKDQSIGSNMIEDVKRGTAEFETYPINKVSKGTPSAKVAKEEEPAIIDVKDKRMMCTYSKRMGSYTGQGRTNAETGAFEQHGEGYMIISDSVFRGSFVSNKREGHGSDLNSRGFGYTGEWKDDKKHGFGSTKDAAGLSEGRWENDNRVGPHTYWFHDGKMCLKNHINNRDLCGPSLTFSSNCGTVKSFEDGVLEVIKPELAAYYVQQMGASVPSPRKLF